MCDEDFYSIAYQRLDLFIEVIGNAVVRWRALVSYPYENLMTKKNICSYQSNAIFILLPTG